MAVKIKKTKEQDIYELAEHIRDIDRKELLLSSGNTPLEALKYGVNRSYCAWTIFHKGKVIGIFGAAKHCVLSTNACVWLLGAENFFKVKRDLLVHSKEYIKKMLAPVDKLENDVWVENKASIRWLKWCGFKFEAPRSYGISKEPFMHFYLGKEDKHV